MLSKILHSKITISLSLFLLAFIPRLLDLGRFLTPDEFLWVDRSRNFLAGLTNPAYQCSSVVEQWGYTAEGLACTLRTGHPGVTTMWTGTVGLILTWLSGGRPAPLHEYVVNLSTNPLDAGLIAPERLTTVIITSLSIVAFYWLLRRLVGGSIALVTAALVATAPFHIALSRVIHHDALSTTFMTLAVLTALIYWGQSASRTWLVASGILTGFAFLSKSPALYLMPFIALTGLWFILKGRSPTTEEWKKFIRHPSSFILITDGLIWFACAAAIFFIFWPAMWVAPMETLETVFFIGSKYATGGHAKGNFFWGEISKDPGPLFYPVSWLFRISPLVLIGLISLPVTWLLERKNGKNSSFIPSTGSGQAIHPSSFIRYLPLILLYILGYYILMTIGEKKQGRYFLPVYPWFDLLAAAGLVGLANYVWLLIKSFRPAQLTPNTPVKQHALRITGPLLAVIILINGFLIIQHFPYYFTYYNPLLGGPTAAANMLTIGWGEGLDQVAGYLNHQPNPAQTRVASWYQSTFAPFYQGQAISYSKEKGKALAGDYVIFYINQTQRQFPDEIMFDYFTRRFSPQQTITLEGVDYAWVYPSLGVDHYIEDQTYTGIASLLAWQWLNGDAPLKPGGSAEFELYWEFLGKEVDEPFFFRLVDVQGRPWAENRSQLDGSRNPSPESWREGEILVETGRLEIPAGTPSGLYQLQIGFYTRAPAVTGGELLFQIPPDEAAITVDSATQPDFVLPAEATPIDQPLDDSLTLLGAVWPGKPHHAGDTISLDLYWQIEQVLPANTELHLGLMDETGQAQQAWFNLSLAETFNAENSGWPAEDVILTRWELELLPEVPPGRYHFELVWPDNIEITLPFGELTITQ